MLSCSGLLKSNVAARAFPAAAQVGCTACSAAWQLTNQYRLHNIHVCAPSWHHCPKLYVLVALEGVKRAHTCSQAQQATDLLCDQDCRASASITPTSVHEGLQYCATGYSLFSLRGIRPASYRRAFFNRYSSCNSCCADTAHLHFHPMALRQRLPSTLARLLLLRHTDTATAAAVGTLTNGRAGYSAAALPQYADDDELVAKAGRALEEIKEAGTMKVERQITTPQAAIVGESMHTVLCTAVCGHWPRCFSAALHMEGRMSC